MESPDWLQQVLDSFEVRTAPFMEVAVGGAISAARSGQGDLNDSSWAAFLAEYSAFMFHEKPKKNSIWNTYFAPMTELTAPDGTKRVDPDLEALSGQTVRHWEERVGNTNNSVLRARYADCVWDLESAITGAKRQHKFAKIAAQSYIETAKRDGFAGGMINVASIDQALSFVGVRMLARAVQLAQSIKSHELASAAATEMIDFCSRYGAPAYAGIWLAPFKTLYDQTNLLTPEQEERIIRDLETMLERTSNTENGNDFNPFGAKDAAELLSKHYKKQEETRRLVKIYGSAFEFMAREASPMLALAWMQPVIERYEQVGLKNDSERLANAAAEKGKRIGEDLKTYSVEVPIERELIEQRTDALLAGRRLDHKLFRIGLAFTPTVAEAKKSLDLVRENTPLLAVIGQNIITPEGQTTARIGSLDEDLEGRLQRQTADHIAMLQLFLSHGLSELKRRDSPTANQIVDVFYECPLFSTRRRELVTEGVAAYLAEDWVKAIHVLVPQMEEILRNLLTIIRVPVSKPSKQPGVTDFKNMNDALREERIRTILGEDRWRYLSALYIDRRGINLRNQLAHGLMSYEGFNTYTADLVFHSFLSMCTLRKGQETSE